MFLYYVIWCLIFLPFRILFPAKVINKKNMPAKRGIIACNHLALIDPAILAVHTGRHLHFIAKKELSRVPIFGAAIPKAGSVLVERGVPDVVAVKKVLKILKDDKILAVFPEGTRNKQDSEDMQELKSGAVMFAIKTDSEITPVIIWRRHKLFRRNFIYCGKPFALSAYKGVKMTSIEKGAATALLSDKMAAAREELNLWLQEKRPRLYARYLKKHNAEN